MLRPSEGRRISDAHVWINGIPTDPTHDLVFYFCDPRQHCGVLLMPRDGILTSRAGFVVQYGLRRKETLSLSGYPGDLKILRTLPTCYVEFP